MTIRITGLNSGLDTDSIIEQLVSAYSTKKDKYVKAQTKLSWKQDKWKALNTKIHSLYTSVGNLRFSSAYNMKTTTVSDSTKATVTASDSAINGTQALKISQLAKAGYLTGAQLGSGVSSSSTLEDLGYDTDGGTISVTSGGTTTDIAVDKTTKISDFVTKLNSAGVSASYDDTNKRIFVTASDSGADNDFSMTGSDANGTSALSALGLNVESDANSGAYADWALYAQNSDGTAYFQYDTDGALTTVGTYDETATNSYIENCLAAVTAAKASTTSLTAANATLNTAITTNKSELKYANAYAATQDVLSASTLTAGQKTDISSLATMSTTDLAKTYALDEDGNLKRDVDGKLVEATSEDTSTAVGSTKLKELETTAGLITTDEDGTEDKTAATSFIANMKIVSAIETAALDDTATDDEKAVVSDVHDAYTAGTISDLTTDLQSSIDADNATITANKATIATNDATISEYELISNGSDADTLTDRVTYAMKNLGFVALEDGESLASYSTGASRINGQDSNITLNGAAFTSSSNTYSINGLTIEATAVTGDDEVSITTKTDTDGLYDKVKSFITQYNTLINEMTSLYNADSAKGYEPLTSDEKDSMTDTEIEDWEDKIKDALLRRDDTLDGVMNIMENSMSKAYTVNGKSYSLSTFGISTLGVLNASEDEENAYHIAGDSTDTASSSKTDKLKAAIETDPDSLEEFMKQLSTGLYDALDTKMKSTSLRSAYTVYNDKEMATEYSDYTTTISKWETKVSDLEDSYYKKFAAMESALAVLQSNASSLSSMLS